MNADRSRRRNLSHSSAVDASHVWVRGSRSGPLYAGLLAIVCEDNEWEYGWEYGLVSAGGSSLQLVATSSRGRCSYFRLTNAARSGSRRTLIPRSLVRVQHGP
jgi:hypothetical protein